MNDVLTLITQNVTTDEYADRVITETTREVFCEIASIGEKEFYQAHAVGLQPEIKFILPDYYEYQGETYVQHNGVRYKVIRTYRKGYQLEITCTREINNHTPPPTPNEESDG